MNLCATAKPSLPKLLAALAAGAKSVNNLPSSEKNNDDESENDSDNDDDDEFGYQMAFPEFNSLCLETRSSLSSILNQSIRSSMGQLHNLEGGKNNDDEEGFDFDDPRLWDNAAETCESLLERVDIYIQNVKEGRAGLELKHLHTLRQAGRNKAKGGEFDRLLGSLVDMAKPQITFGFADEVQNSRTEPFCPTLNQFSDCTLEVVQGHGLDSIRYGGEVPLDIIAPKHHYLHPYQNIIETFGYKDEQFQIEESGVNGWSGTLHNKSLGVMKGIWIDTEHELTKLVSRIEGNPDFQEIAIDLEAHNYRSFSGFVCTMQLSLRRPPVTEGTLASAQHQESIDNGYDFIIDTLALRSVMNKYFAPIFANPNIVKVMHGADSDVQWLQRDFGIYIVNLFDTGRASRVLPHFDSAGLAYLLKKYANVEADKKHQLSDWRQRPLPDEMLQYAISDTMYLLDIYDKMKAEIAKFECDEISIKAVLDACRTVCLSRYDKEPFNPNGYKHLITSKRARRRKVNLSKQQEEILKQIYEWRDATGRKEDESLQFVCPNSGLVRIASTTPENVSSLQACMNPIPPLVLQYSNEILRIIHKCLHNSQFKAPANQSDKNLEQSRNNDVTDVGVISRDKHPSSVCRKVLSSEMDASFITFETSLRKISKKRKVNELSIHPSNKNFKTDQCTLHSIDMKAKDKTRCHSVDGLGAAMAVFQQMEKEESKMEQNTVDIQRKIAIQCANRIRQSLMEKNTNLLGLVKVSKFIDSEINQAQTNEEIESKHVSNDDNNLQNELPKSIKEVYRISNSKEKRTKPSSSVGDDNAASENLHKSTSHQPQKKESNKEADANSEEEIEQIKPKNNELKQKKTDAPNTFDYSKLQLGHLKIFDPNAKISENPFFEGVARSGGLAQHNEQQRNRRRK